MSINAKYNTNSNIYRYCSEFLKAVIFGLTATVESAGLVDSIDMRNSFSPLVMILLLFDIVCVIKCVRLLFL